MRSLYVRIWLTVVVALALFGFASAWMMQQHFEGERVRAEGVAQERLNAWADLLERTLPGADAPRGEQAMALRDWSMRLRMPMALDDAKGQRLATSDVYARREAEGTAQRAQPVRLDDGRTLWVLRPGLGRGGGGALGGALGNAPTLLALRMLPDGMGLALLLLLLFMAVAAGAWPVVRRLTRRLEALKLGVEAFGQGALHQRVAEDGQDEVAALGASFNRAATRIEALLRSHQSLLANASHELRSPLARLKMAVSLAEDATPAQRATLRTEIATNIAELDALVEEVLLASRLDASLTIDMTHSVELLGLAAEEAARVDALVQGVELKVQGDERLLRRALRNLLENARRYGGGVGPTSGADAVAGAVAGADANGGHGAGSDIELSVRRIDAARAEVRVCDRGPGVPEAYRERIFEPFFRLPGHAEREGGVGLGLALVRQIAQRHGGSVRCEAREGGGSCFVLMLPLANV